jgi:hypothetical protein
MEGPLVTLSWTFSEELAGEQLYRVRLVSPGGDIQEELTTQRTLSQSLMDTGRYTWSVAVGHMENSAFVSLGESEPWSFVNSGTPTATATNTHTATATSTETPRPTDTPAPPTATATVTRTPTPQPQCTPLPCPDGVLVCQRESCADGCGYACITPTPAVPLEPGVVTAVRMTTEGWGEGDVWVEFRDGIELVGADGKKYRAGLGFINEPAALAEMQKLWNWGSRSGAAWRMRIVVRKSVGWVSCPANPVAVCSELKSEEQGLLGIEVLYGEELWRQLLNEYLAGGNHRVSQHPLYSSIQGSIFRFVCNCDVLPGRPIIGFRFEPVQ